MTKRDEIAFNAGWDSAIKLYEMIENQSEQCEIDRLRDFAFQLFVAAENKVIKELGASQEKKQEPVEEEKPPYPCTHCGVMEAAACCGCPVEMEWQHKYGGKK